MASWLQNQIRAAEGLLEAVDRTAKHVSKKEQQDGQSAPARPLGGPSGSLSSTTTVPLRGQDDRAIEHFEAAALLHSERKASNESPRLLSTNVPKNSSNTAQAPSLAPSGINSNALEPPKSGAPVTQLADPEAVPLASLFGAPRSGSVAETGRQFEEPSAASPKAERPKQQREGLGGAHETQPGEQASESPRYPSNAHAVSRQEETANSLSNGHGEPSDAAQSSPVARESDNQLPEASHIETGLPLQSGAALEDQSLQSDAKEIVSAPSVNQLSNAPSTADAVAEAIKAATAATGSQEAGEDVEGLTDARVREARLAKMVESLKRRLEQLRAENTQLEEMLQQADANVSGRAGDIGRLEDALASAQAAESSVKAQAIEAAERHKAELGAKEAALEAANARLKEAQSRLASSEEENDKLLQEREMSEARMLAALREEVTVAERRLEDERFASASARQGFSAREQELEATLSESAASLAKQQRAMEEKARRLAAAENRAAALEAGKTELQAQLQSAKDQLPRQQDSAEAASLQKAEQQLQERAASLQAALTNSESQRHGLEVELSQIRLENDNLKRQAAHAISPAEMEQRLREMTDLLYQKQSQLEKVAAERAAQQMAWERELSTWRDDAERQRRRVKTDRAMTFVDGDLVVPMEDIASYQRLANHKRVGRAVKAGARFLDATTLTAVRFLRQYPLGRSAQLAEHPCKLVVDRLQNVNGNSYGRASLAAAEEMAVALKCYTASWMPAKNRQY